MSKKPGSWGDLTPHTKRFVPVTRVLEIGTGHGTSAMFWASNLSEGGTIVSVDVRDRLTETQRNALTDLCDSRHIRFCHIIGDSKDSKTVSECAKLGPYDGLSIDGRHDRVHMESDWQEYGPLVKAGGWIAFHDVCHTKCPEAREFWGEFCRAHPEAETLPTDTGTGVGFVRKPPNVLGRGPGAMGTYVDRVESEQVVVELVESGEPCAVVRFGDGDLALMAHPDVQYIPNIEHLCRATERSDATLRTAMAEAMRTADVAELRESWEGCERLPYFAPDFAQRVMDHYGVTPKRLVSINCMYKLTASGRLFKALAGRRVALVGTHAYILESIWQEPEFQTYYADLGVGAVEMAGSVLTPMANASPYEPLIWRNLCLLAKHVKPSAVLLSCGNIAKPLTVRVRDELGIQAIDWGELMSIMAGIPRRTRPHIGKRFEYRSDRFSPRPTAREVNDMLFWREACLPALDGV